MFARSSLLIISVLILIILIGGLFYFNQTKQVSSQKSSAPSPTLLAPKPTQKPTPTPIPEDWETFKSEDFGISIRHPKDFEASETQEGVRIVKLGPTQSQGTELYDGISLLLKTGILENQNLEEFVDAEIAETKAQPINAKVSEKREVQVLELPGFSYDVSSLGDARYIFLPKGPGGYLEIINSTIDPSNLGYQKTVDLIISSIEF